MTAGADVVGRIIQRRDAPDPATFLGSGKVERAPRAVPRPRRRHRRLRPRPHPAQQRNLERLLGRTAIDRTAVILDIFAQNARSPRGQGPGRAGAAALPAASPAWPGPEPLAAGGWHRHPWPGRDPARGRSTPPGAPDAQARGRAAPGDPDPLLPSARQRGRGRRREVALVGYTNAGKSTLLNRLTDAGVPAADRLFETLDPRTRQLALPGGEVVLVTDTVGFVSKLPHELVEAFRSTLDSVRLAGLLLHVVNAAAPDPRAQIDAVRATLTEIGAARGARAGRDQQGRPRSRDGGWSWPQSSRARSWSQRRAARASRTCSG